jgi:hypothetical protein
MNRASFIFLVFAIGCNSGGTTALPLYPVTGTVKVDGKPLDATSVTLIPTDTSSKMKPATGMSDKEGNFKIATNGDRGAAAGSYKVVLGGAGISEPTEEKKNLTSQEQAAEAMKQQGELIKNKGRPATKKFRFPSEWADPKTTPKTFEVKSGTNTLNIDI